jgi:hypothetical protein
VAADPGCGGGAAALIAAVTDRLGMADRIALNADAWDTRPQRVTTGGKHVVRLDWSGAWDAHTIRLTGRDPSHLDLLVIPPDTATVLDLTCLAIAAVQNMPPEPTGGSLSDRHPGRCRRLGRSRRAQREQASRWETDGRRVRELT